MVGRGVGEAEGKGVGKGVGEIDDDGSETVVGNEEQAVAAKAAADLSRTRRFNRLDVNRQRERQVHRRGR